MSGLIRLSQPYRAYRHWLGVADDMKDPSQLLALADNAIEILPQLREVQEAARRIVDRYPESDGARALQDILQLTDEDKVAQPSYLDELKEERRKLTRS